MSQEFPPETGWGGIGAYVDVVARAVADRGVDVHVLSVVEGQTPSTRLVDGVTVHRFPLPRLRGVGRLTRCPETVRRLSLAGAVARLVAGLPARPTSVECPEWRAEGLGLGLRPSLPLVVRLHSAARQIFPYTGQGRGLGGLDGRAAARAEEVSARRSHVVTGTRSNLAEMGPRLRVDRAAVRVISHPVRLPAAVPLPADAPPRVVFVGRLEPRKAPQVLLRAAPRVLAAIPDARFVFVGRDGTAAGGPSSGAAIDAEATRLGIRDAVELAGHLDRTEVDDQLRRATVCVFPSRWESFGSVVAEAAAIGRPVVTSEIPAFGDLVEPGVTGHRVAGDDPEDWARAIVDVLGDRARARELGLAGSALAHRLSDPAAVAEQTVAAHLLAGERWRLGRRVGL